MKKIISGVGVFFLTVMIAGCQTISKDAKYQLSKDIDCSTASSDIEILENEKASVGKQMAAGVRSILPVAAVVGLLSRDYKNRVEVATGKYNKDLENKIADIKSTCGME